MPTKITCGKELWQKTETVKEKVRQLLYDVPGTRGDDRLLELYYRVRYEGYNPRHAMSFSEAIKMWRVFVSAETLIRRRAEIQNETNPDGSWKNPELRPKERTQRKREARANAATSYYGTGTYRLPDYQDVVVSV